MRQRLFTALAVVALAAACAQAAGTRTLRPTPGAVDTAPGCGAIEGVVLQPDGKPFPAIEAHVSYADPERRLYGGAVVEVGEGGRYRIERVRAGTYTLSIGAGGGPPHRSAMEPCSGTLRNVVVAAGKTTQAGTLRTSGGTSGEGPKSRTVEGRVLKPDGTPAAGAFVGQYRERDGMSGPVGADGTFHSWVNPGGRLRLVASLAGFLPAKAELRYTGPGEEKVDLRLRPMPAGQIPAAQVIPPAVPPTKPFVPGAVEGVLLLPGGSPLPAGARATVRTARSPDAPARQVHFQGDVRTSSGGRFRFDLIGGHHTLRIQVPGYAPAVWEDVEVVAGGTTRLAPVRLGQGATLRGRVMKPDGSPAAGAVVSLDAPEGLPPAKAGPDGSFHVARLAHGRAGIKAVLAPWVPASLEATLPAAGPVQIRLAKGAVIEGVVRDSRGRLLANVEVSAGPVSASTDAAGRYRIEGVAPGHVAVSAGGEWLRSLRAAACCTVAPGETATVDLTPSAPAVLLGVLLRPDGTPLSGGRVWVSHADMNSVCESRELQVPIQPDGSFRIDGLLPGHYGCTLKVPGFRPVEVPSRRIGVGAIIRLEPIRLAAHPDDAAEAR